MTISTRSSLLPLSSTAGPIKGRCSLFDGPCCASEVVWLEERKKMMLGTSLRQIVEAVQLNCYGCREVTRMSVFVKEGRKGEVAVMWAQEFAVEGVDPGGMKTTAKRENEKPELGRREDIRVTRVGGRNGISLSVEDKECFNCRNLRMPESFVAINNNHLFKYDALRVETRKRQSEQGVPLIFQSMLESKGTKDLFKIDCLKESSAEPFKQFKKTEICDECYTKILRKIEPTKNTIAKMGRTSFAPVLKISIDKRIDLIKKVLTERRDKKKSFNLVLNLHRALKGGRRNRGIPKNITSFKADSKKKYVTSRDLRYSRILRNSVTNNSTGRLIASRQTSSSAIRITRPSSTLFSQLKSKHLSSLTKKS